MFEHVIDTPTVIGRHNVPQMAQYVADQFKAAGFPAADIHVLPYHTGSATTGDDDTAALIVRWRAAGTSTAKPILLMGHMDVVEAKPEDWSIDPFKMIEKDGYYYGRGTTDMKDGIVAITQAMIDLKEGRVQAEARHRRAVHGRRGDQRDRRQEGRTEWLDLLGHPEYGLNADGGGGGFNPDGISCRAIPSKPPKKPSPITRFTVRNRGGHSSKPRKDNAIYSLSHALDKLEAYRFQPMMNETTRAYFEGRAEDGEGAARRRDAALASKSERWRSRRHHRSERKRGRPDPHSLRRRPAFSLATPTMPCRSWPGRSSIAAFSPASIPMRSAPSSSGWSPIPRSR